MGIKQARSMGILFIPAVMVTAGACGGSKPPSAKAPVPAPVLARAPEGEVGTRERVTPHMCGTRTKLSQLLGQAAPAPAPPSDERAASAPPPTSAGSNTRLQGNQAYRLVAPSTVIVRSERSMGTGVVVDPNGYVLTNFHVVEGGQAKDFVIHVNVSLGNLTSTGRMVRQDKTYEAVVVKADPVRDLALVRIVDPPKLSALKLAKNAPQIGERVTSVGHAAIGFLWAAKTCSIASIGERQQDASILAGLDCSRSDPSVSAEEVAKQKKSCNETKQRITESFTAQTQGLALQTDCAITHGDSGGPLVNSAGELVGLNQSISADLATASFHVHLDEIRNFVAQHGDSGIPILPDPWCDGGVNTTLEDIDLDGTPDTIVTKGNSTFLGGYDRMGLLIDLDQDHYARKTQPLDPFDAEIAFLTIRDVAYVWYDTDGDSRFDRLLVDKDNDGKPELGYRIDAAGRPELDKRPLPAHDIDPSLISDPASHPRLKKLARFLGGSRYASAEALASAKKATALPDVFGVGAKGRTSDLDHNGKSDTVYVGGTFSRALLIDVDEDSLKSIRPGEAADDLLKARKVDAELSLIVQGKRLWAIYDTDNDAKADLALMTRNGGDSTWLFATHAWRVGGDGELTAAPEQIGRKLLRPRLLSSPRTTGLFANLNYATASNEGDGALPDPRAPRGNFHFRELAGFPKGTVIEAQSAAGSTILIDLDRDTKLPPKADAEAIVNSGKFDAEVALIDRGGMEWVYYDTNGDGRFDLVLFVAKEGQDPTNAFRIVGDGKGISSLEVDTTAIAGKPIRHGSVFKDKKMAAKCKKIVEKLFEPRRIEE